MKGRPKAPSPEVVAKQDPEHTEEAFLADLDRATRRLEADPGPPAASGSA
jgi:hypothetical protein